MMKFLLSLLLFVMAMVQPTMAKDVEPVQYDSWFGCARHLFGKGVRLFKKC